MDVMIALAFMAALVVLAAMAGGFGFDSRGYEPRSTSGEHR
jgi:hypothetical protein